MARPRKVVEVKDVIEVVEVAEAVEAPKPVKAKKVDVAKLKAILWKSNLNTMKEAVAEIEGDKLTMDAVKGILNAPNSGIAAQHLQQIIQRNS
jgi:hypothetical protein